MNQNKAVVLFSGGKDSVYSLEKAYEEYEIALLLTCTDESGETIYTDGYEAPHQIMKSLSQLYQKALIKKGHKTDIKSIKTSKTNTVNNLYEKLVELCKKNDIGTIITGDLNHPDGLDKALTSRGIEKFGIKVISPAGDHFKTHGSLQYIKTLIELDFGIKIIGARKNDLPKKYIGQTLNHNLLKKWSKELENFDVSGEDGEYQSLILDSPLLREYIKVREYKISPYEKGRDNKNHLYSRMIDIDFKIIEKP